MLMCIEASSGHVLYSERLRGKYNASPIYAAGRIYLFSTNGETTVIGEGPELRILSENSLEGEIWATPAVVRNSMLIRTSAYLYRVGR